MLTRSPGITIAGTLAIAVAIALGTIYFEAVNKWRNPRLPIADAERVVSIRNWNAADYAVDARAMHDFALWRDEVRTVENLGAAMVFARNLATPDGRVEPVRGVEITAIAFALMGTPPLHGRTLSPQDEQPGAPPVVVIGHRLWNARFASDPTVVGSTVKLGTATATIVGVMPEGFAFPTSEQLWAPLRLDGASLDPRTGPPVSVFGRLAPGVSMRAAQAELSGIGARMAADHPGTHEHLRPVVTSYAKPLTGGQQAVIVRTILSVLAGIFLALLAIMCTNVATLVFARTASRGWEISVRSALGASRGCFPFLPPATSSSSPASCWSPSRPSRAATNSSACSRSSTPSTKSSSPTSVSKRSSASSSPSSRFLLTCLSCLPTAPTGPLVGVVATVLLGARKTSTLCPHADP
jgi:hypothetical protein